MSRIAVILDEDFEDSEYQKPVEALRVEDKNIISSRSPKDIPAFNNRIINKLK